MLLYSQLTYWRKATVVTQTDERIKKKALRTILAIQNAGERYLKEHKDFLDSQKSRSILEF